MATGRGRAAAVLFAAGLPVCGCQLVGGIQDISYDPDASAGPGSDDGGKGPDGSQVPDAPAADATDASYASCSADGSAGAVCGPVTNGSWSACSYESVCSDSGSRTREVTTPTCMGGACVLVMSKVTDMVGCARDTTGMSCGSGQACKNQSCVCAPQCTGKNCGPDGCGGNCGSCSGGNHVCNGAGMCTCTPTMGCVSGGNVGNICAADDGCGGPCTCDAQNGESCANGVCCHNPMWYCATNADCCSGTCLMNLCN